MKNAVILHGTGADSHSNWFQWMKEKLSEKGGKVWVPNLPNSMYPNSLVNAKFVLDRWEFNEDSLIIGHSSGAVLALYLLQNLPEDVVVDRVFLVSVFKDDLGWPNLKDIFVEPLDWEKIKSGAREIVILQSSNDPHIPLDQAEFIAKKLDAELIVKKGQDHFNVEVGVPFGHFPTLLNLIEEP